MVDDLTFSYTVISTIATLLWWYSPSFLPGRREKPEVRKQEVYTRWPGLTSGEMALPAKLYFLLNPMLGFRISVCKSFLTQKDSERPCNLRQCLQMTSSYLSFPLTQLWPTHSVSTNCTSFNFHLLLSLFFVSKAFLFFIHLLYLISKMRDDLWSSALPRSHTFCNSP